MWNCAAKRWTTSGGRFVLRDANHLKAVAVLLLKGDQVRDFRPARAAPRRPEVDDDDLAAQRRGREFVSVEVARDELRRRLRVAVEAKRDRFSRFCRRSGRLRASRLDRSRVARRGPHECRAAQGNREQERSTGIHPIDKCKLKPCRFIPCSWTQVASLSTPTGRVSARRWSGTVSSSRHRRFRTRSRAPSSGSIVVRRFKVPMTSSAGGRTSISSSPRRVFR